MQTTPRAKLTVIQATRMWNDATTEFVNTHAQNEYGSCVMGAGIQIIGGPFIRAPDYAQGSLTWENSVPQVLAFLKREGMDAYYNPGRMD